MVNQDALTRQIERTFNCEVETGPNGLVSSVYFPEFTINNLAEDRQHRITDLYVTVENTSLYGVRYSHTIEELVNKYCHSHLPSMNVIKIGDGSARLTLDKMKFCIGTGELNKWLISHNSGNVKPEEFNFPFVATLKQYLECESSEGVPHMRLRNLGTDNISGNSNSYYSTVDFSTINNLLTVVKESVSVMVSNNKITVTIDRKRAAELILASRSVPPFLRRDSYFTYSLVGERVGGYNPGSVRYVSVHDRLNIIFKGRQLQYIYPDGLDTNIQEPEKYIVKQLEKQISDAVKSKILYHSSSIKRDEWLQSTEGNPVRRSLEKDTLALW